MICGGSAGGDGALRSRRFRLPTRRSLMRCSSRCIATIGLKRIPPAHRSRHRSSCGRLPEAATRVAFRRRIATDRPDSTPTTSTCTPGGRWEPPKVATTQSSFRTVHSRWRHDERFSMGVFSRGPSRNPLHPVRLVTQSTLRPIRVRRPADLPGPAREVRQICDGQLHLRRRVARSLHVWCRLAHRAYRAPSHGLPTAAACAIPGPAALPMMEWECHRNIVLEIQSRLRP